MGSGAARAGLLSGSHHGPFGKIEELSRTDPQWLGSLRRSPPGRPRSRGFPGVPDHPNERWRGGVSSNHTNRMIPVHGSGRDMFFGRTAGTHAAVRARQAGPALEGAISLTGLAGLRSPRSH